MNTDTYVTDLDVAIDGLDFLCQTIYARNVKAGWWSDLHFDKKVQALLDKGFDEVQITEILGALGIERDGKRNVPEMLCLIHSEISEAYEAYRHKNIDDRDGFKEELGDAIQRILHLCGVMNVDVEGAILAKLNSNKGRNWDWGKMNEKHS